ncbi:AdoMet dependent proline di-methyltransferase-domain-containing protein [Phanerochaete sordida]|uniref:Alpha N-terminal protein methyltransferase 1 n=1 Tax=Phanerochaete sordida TaxID=48140 RepID=A0A9P3G3F5_9APHY|nr:AdoMet dependent proline di-methyltransferase-domain-containing protein [Phanerochaete sordida]
MSTAAALPEPDVRDGIEYWNTQPASYDGVLGGFGNGSLPRVDALGSRQFLMHLRPDLCTVPSAVRPLSLGPPSSAHRTRAVDVGAGVGRVTADVLLHLVHDVVLLEPVEGFIAEAHRRGQASADGTLVEDGVRSRWKGVADGSRSVTLVQGTLQAFDPCSPLRGTKLVGRVGYTTAQDDLESKFDVVWCQWCLGHLSDADLIAFFKRCKQALRDAKESLIVVKENLCSDDADGSARTVFDEDDSSLTRSDMAWKAAFATAGLTLVYEQVQRGFPEGLYEVKMYALR